MNWFAIYHLIKRRHRACFLKIFAHFHQIEVKQIVEVGVFQGKNARVLREMFPQAHLYLVDPWTLSPEYLHSGGAVSKNPKVYEQARRKVEMCFAQDHLVIIIPKTSEEALCLTPDNLDLVFIDANHSYSFVKQDIIQWTRKVRIGGIISGHNYGRSHLPGVKQAVDELFSQPVCIGQDEVWATIKKHAGEDSNLQPPDPKSGTLSIELPALKENAARHIR